VLGQACDFGIAFDGDGDRIGVIDEKGRILWGDQLLILYGRDILSRRPGATMIADVKASQVLFDELARAGGNPVMWKTGHSLIKSKMAETGAVLAGEMSGHIFFADHYYGFDDALYAAVRLVDLLSRAPESLATFRDRLPQVVNTPEIRFPCAEARKRPAIEEVRKRLEAKKAQVVGIDGVRVRTEDGWWLLRASNTQDVLVARCEASSAEGLRRLRLAAKQRHPDHADVLRAPGARRVGVAKCGEVERRRALQALAPAVDRRAAARRDLVPALRRVRALAGGDGGLGSIAVRGPPGRRRGSPRWW